MALAIRGSWKGKAAIAGGVLTPDCVVTRSFGTLAAPLALTRVELPLEFLHASAQIRELAS